MVQLNQAGLNLLILASHPRAFPTPGVIVLLTFCLGCNFSPLPIVPFCPSPKVAAMTRSSHLRAGISFLHLLHSLYSRSTGNYAVAESPWYSPPSWMQVNNQNLIYYSSHVE